MQKNKILELNNEMLKFISDSPTAYQAVENVAAELDKAGFGDNYVIRNGSSLIAYKFPNCMSSDNENVSGSDIKGFRIICAHTDSPMFKIKENPETKNGNGYVKLNVEKYGGMIVNTWLDRPLSVAGRIVYDNGSELVSHNIDLKKPLYIIPNLAIHMSRGGEEKQLSIQTDLQPIGDEGLYDLLAENAGNISKDDILGADLYLYNACEGCLVGNDKSYVCSPRLDDMQCVYTAFKAFIEATSSEYVNVLAVFDNEEVGSLTRQGADSDFLKNTLLDIADMLDTKPQDYRKMLNQSFMISADNAHAVHPNRPEKADVTNKPLINQGIVIKYHGGQKYTTDAYTGAFVKKICKDNDIKYQTYHNNSDIAGGSTLGNLVQANVSIPAADIGVAQLAMHSSYETAGAEDTVNMYEFMKAFYRG